jgi:hypothetical protein
MKEAIDMLTNNPEESQFSLVAIAYTLFGILIIGALFWGEMTKDSCIFKSSGEDKYCFKEEVCYSNHTNSCHERWVVKSHAQDEIDRLYWEKIHKENEERERIRIECYNNGSDYNFSFDIIKDYGLSCNKLKYINDHFIDKSRQVDGGYIEGSYSGLFSYGHIEGQLYQYVTEQTLATGQLVQSTKYHLNCNNEESDRLTDFYTESEFIMYYVERCLQ